jgi:hypothetical protein
MIVYLKLEQSFPSESLPYVGIRCTQRPYSIRNRAFLVEVTDFSLKRRQADSYLEIEMFRDRDSSDKKNFFN